MHVCVYSLLQGESNLLGAFPSYSTGKRPHPFWGAPSCTTPASTSPQVRSLTLWGSEDEVLH